jgi:hypothetical protein
VKTSSSEVEVHFTPAQHWSARWLGDHRATFWAAGYEPRWFMKAQHITACINSLMLPCRLLHLLFLLKTSDPTVNYTPNQRSGSQPTESTVINVKEEA